MLESHMTNQRPEVNSSQAQTMRRQSPIHLTATIFCWLLHCSSALVLVSPSLTLRQLRSSACEQLFGNRAAGQHSRSTISSSSTSAKEIALRILDTTAINFERQPALLAASSSIGFWGHSGLALVSVVLVKIVYALFFRPNDDDAPQQAGMLNRCPWPFIFFHDVKQGLRDSPTWMVVTWVILWRLSKIVKPSAAVP